MDHRVSLLPTAPAAVAPLTPGMVPGLTSIRGIAAWWVVLYHFSQWLPHGSPKAVELLLSHGYLGVDLFFVLSGYVISLNYASKMSTPGARQWVSFLWLRLARIYPLHLLLLVLFVPAALAKLLLSKQGVPPNTFDIGYFLLSLILAQNWGFTRYLEWNAPAWSISVEWLSYILFPLTLWLARGPLRNRLACWAMALGALVLLGCITPYFANDSGITKLGPLRGLLEFWAGVCLFHARSWSVSSEKMIPWAGLTLSAACVGIWLALGIPNYYVVPAAFLFLVWALSCPTGAVARIMSGRFITYLGTISYSTYLVHMLIYYWANALLRPGMNRVYLIPVCLILTLVMSDLLYRSVELPGRRALRRIDPVTFWREAASRRRRVGV